MLSIGERIAWARGVIGWSAAKLGRAIGKSSSYVLHLEKGLYNPGVKGTMRLAEVLGTNVPWLVDGAGAEPSERALKRAAGKHDPDAQKGAA